MKNILVLVGAPNSGKTNFRINNKLINTWNVFDYSEYKRNYLITDKCFNERRYQLLQSFIYKNDSLVIEGEHSSKRSRQNIYKIAKEYDEDAKVTIILFIDSLINTSSSNIESLLDYNKKRSVPKIGSECDELYIYNNNNNNTFNIDKYIADSFFIPHNSIYHLESIGMHAAHVTYKIEDDRNLLIEKLDSFKKVKLTEDDYDYFEYEDSEEGNLFEYAVDGSTKIVKVYDYDTSSFDNLITIAKWHDIGKVVAKSPFFGTSYFSGHENISANEFLAHNTPFKTLFKISPSNSEYLIAEAISDHMKAHEQINLVSPLTRLFTEYDSSNLINVPIKHINVKYNDIKLRKYVTSLESASCLNLSHKYYLNNNIEMFSELLIYYIGNSNILNLTEHLPNLTKNDIKKFLNKELVDLESLLGKSYKSDGSQVKTDSDI